jgi:hypothetical protein
VKNQGDCNGHGTKKEKGKKKNRHIKNHILLSKPNNQLLLKIKNKQLVAV